MRSIPEDFEQIHIPARVIRSMEQQGIPVLAVSNAIGSPDLVKQGDAPGRWVAERTVEGGAVIRAEYGVRHRPTGEWDEEWAEIEAERAVELAVHLADPSSSNVELKTAVVVKRVTRTERRR